MIVQYIWPLNLYLLMKKPAERPTQFQSQCGMRFSDMQINEAGANLDNGIIDSVLTEQTKHSCGVIGQGSA
ncbi:MAG: hypothetical protein EKK69_12970 [Candidatus Competibacteraceae bacterium]|nr:MAG: hypothetical protein EKK69_12970 [Candidatus Competibacteraceae bacterium]